MTDPHDRYADDLAAYALGALNELEATAFERHLMRCDTCARELAELRAVVAGLSAAVPQYRAPGELKHAVMDAIRQEPAEQPDRVEPRRPRRSRAWLLRLVPQRPTLALLGVLAAVALAVGAYGLGVSGSGGDRVVVAAAVDRTQLPGARGELAASGDLGVLRAAGLPPAGRGRVYVVWVDRGQGPVYASSFNVEPDGRGEAGIGDLDGVERVMVTREPSTAVAHPSESPILTAELS